MPIARKLIAEKRAILDALDGTIKSYDISERDQKEHDKILAWMVKNTTVDYPRSAGVVAKELGISKYRVMKFLDGPSGQMAKVVKIQVGNSARFYIHDGSRERIKKGDTSLEAIKKLVDQTFTLVKFDKEAVNFIIQSTRFKETPTKEFMRHIKVEVDDPHSYVQVALLLIVKTMLYHVPTIETEEEQWQS